jgi:hypothetical protein
MIAALESGGQPARACRKRSGKSSIGQHGFDGLNAGDGLFGERETERDSAEQFAVDIDRAAAHALQNAGLGQWPAAEPGQNDGLLWAQILEHAEDFDLELFDAVTLEDSPADAMEPGANVLEWEEVLSSRQGR